MIVNYFSSSKKQLAFASALVLSSLFASSATMAMEAEEGLDHVTRIISAREFVENTDQWILNWGDITEYLPAEYVLNTFSKLPSKRRLAVQDSLLERANAGDQEAQNFLLKLSYHQAYLNKDSDKQVLPLEKINRPALLFNFYDRCLFNSDYTSYVLLNSDPLSPSSRLLQSDTSWDPNSEAEHFNPNEYERLITAQQTENPDFQLHYFGRLSCKLLQNLPAHTDYHPNNMFNLGLLCWLGWPGNSCTKTFPVWKEAADNGHARAALELGDAIHDEILHDENTYNQLSSLGIFELPNNEVAVKYLEQAAQAGYSSAQYRLFTIYNDDSQTFGLKYHKPQQAMYWLKESADRGYPAAIEDFKKLNQ